MNLLHDRLISVQLQDGSATKYCLPEVLAALANDQVHDFPALRPHQRTAWHSLMVQIGALACHAQQSASLPSQSEVWREWLLSLTTEWPGGEAWALTATDVRHPAFLQAPEPSGSLAGFKAVVCADDLDVLATSKNHDVKQSTLFRATPEQWLFALVMLQTQQGFLGAGNYGISRMNGGFSNRPFFGVRPSGGPGRWFQRDIRALLLGRELLQAAYPTYPAMGGLALLWLAPWDGATSLRPNELDPWYVEICRRIRLVESSDASIVAMSAGSRVARVDAKGLSGRTGDGWTPLVEDGSDFKALTTQPHTFSYRALVPIIFPGNPAGSSIRRAPLQIVSNEDDESGLAIVACALVRGQGKTEGFYLREIPISRATRRFLTYQPTDEAADTARRRVEEASLMSREVLYPAALAVMTGSPSRGERKRDDDTAKERARTICGAFEQAVDADFFEALNDELAALDDTVAREAIREDWRLSLASRARLALAEGMSRAPDSAARHYRTQARSLLIFDERLHRHFNLAARTSSAHKTPDVSNERNSA